MFYNLTHHPMLKLLSIDVAVLPDLVTKAKPLSFCYQLKNLMLNLLLSIKKLIFKKWPCRILCRICPIYCQFLEIGKKMTGPYLTWQIGPLLVISNHIQSMSANTS